MVQSTESREGVDCTQGSTSPRYWSTGWRVLGESEVSTIFVVVAHILGHQPLEVLLIQYDHVIQHRSRRQLPTQRSATRSCHGLRKAVRVGWLPKSFTAEITSVPNFESRLNKGNLCADR